VLAACGNAHRLVVVGLESLFLDPLVEALPTVRCALLSYSQFQPDWDRVLSNYGGRVEQVTLDTFQGWAGASSVLLTFAYGVNGTLTHVAPGWMRVNGEDVRMQFRTLLAWDVLGAPMFVYPRWLCEVSTESFTDLVEMTVEARQAVEPS
jgi:hypothetical protein